MFLSFIIFWYFSSNPICYSLGGSSDAQLHKVINDSSGYFVYFDVYWTLLNFFSNSGIPFLSLSKIERYKLRLFTGYLFVSGKGKR